jgi:hypothetical protein
VFFCKCIRIGHERKLDNDGILKDKKWTYKAGKGIRRGEWEDINGSIFR